VHSHKFLTVTLTWTVILPKTKMTHSPNQLFTTDLKAIQTFPTGQFLNYVRDCVTSK